MKGFSKASFVYLIAFACYPILFLYGKFPGEADWSLAPLPIFLSVSATLGLFFALRLLLKREALAGCLTIFTHGLFWSYGHVANAVGARVIGGGMGNGENLLYVNPVVGSVYLLFALVFVTWALRKRGWIGFERLHQIFPAISLTLLVMVALSGLSDLIVGEKKGDKIGTRDDFHSNSASKLGYDPDIYFIVLDGYGRGDFLKKYYDFDNSEFLGFLEDKGFQVIDQSWSTYGRTHFSLTSTLNMQMLDEIVAQFGKHRRSRGHLYEFLRNNRVSRFLKERNYRYVHIASTGGETMVNPYADKLYSCRASSFKHEIYRVLVESSALRVFHENFGKDIAQCHLENYAIIREMPTLERSPKFVFAHIVSPHHPYLFDRNGNILRKATISNQFEYEKELWKNKKGYIEQTRFLNKEVQKMVDSLLSKSARPPVIVIASDHGPNYPFPGYTRQEAFTIRHANLTAIHVPGAQSVFPEDLRAVNTFPYLFNHLFDAGLAIQPNTLFQNEGGRYNFVVFKPLEKLSSFPHKGPLLELKKKGIRIPDLTDTRPVLTR